MNLLDNYIPSSSVPHRGLPCTILHQLSAPSLVQYPRCSSIHMSIESLSYTGMNIKSRSGQKHPVSPYKFTGERSGSVSGLERKTGGTIRKQLMLWAYQNRQFPRCAKHTGDAERRAYAGAVQLGVAYQDFVQRPVVLVSPGFTNMFQCDILTYLYF